MVVLDNRPPWDDRANPQHGELRRLEKNGTARVVSLDYTKYYDPSFRQRFFALDDQEADKHLSLGDVRRQVYNGPPGDDGYLGSKFMGMFSFFDLCQNAHEAELCIYVDSDMFLHRGEFGLVDLAYATFEQNPGLVALMPPHMCDAGGPDLHGACAVEPEPDWFSDRLMVVHRGRLRKELPFSTTPDDFNDSFEHLWTMAAGPQQRNGRMTCGEATFALHPSDDLATALEVLQRQPDAGEASPVAGRLRSTRSAGQLDFDTQGLGLLIRRVEDGDLQGDTTNQDCESMGTPSEERIDSGMAWVRVHSQGPR